MDGFYFSCPIVRKSFIPAKFHNFIVVGGESVPTNKMGRSEGVPLIEKVSGSFTAVSCSLLHQITQLLTPAGSWVFCHCDWFVATLNHPIIDTSEWA